MQEKLTKEQRRSLLLAAARKRFAQNGYHETSIDHIIQEADVARGTFYLYFDGKRAIFDAILSSAIDAINANIKVIAVGANEAPPAEQLKANLRRCFTLLLDDKDLGQILFYRALGIDDVCVENLNDFYSQIAALIASALNQGMALGLLAQCDSLIVSHCVLGSIKEAFTSLIMNKNPGDERLDRIIEEILRLHFYGLYTRAI